MTGLLLAVLSAQLTDREREVFIDLNVLERRSNDIARDFGCTRSNVSLIDRSARRKLARCGYITGLRQQAA